MMLYAMDEVARMFVAIGGLVAFLGIQVAAITIAGAHRSGGLLEWWRS
jgi:hypothetical protein